MKHLSKDFNTLIDKVRALNYRIVRNGVTYKIYPTDKTLPLFTAHFSDRGVHPLRRYLKNTCKVNF